MNDFFQIEHLSVSEQQAVVQVRLNEGCSVYKGHFPGHPIAPGACSIEMIRLCAEKSFNREVRFQHIKQCKFTSLIEPDRQTLLTIHLEWNGVQITADITNGPQTAVRFKAQTK